jgi:hypothetical protein
VIESDLNKLYEKAKNIKVFKEEKKPETQKVVKTKKHKVTKNKFEWEDLGNSRNNRYL